MNPPDSKQRITQLKHLQSWETHTARLLGGWLPGIQLWEAKHEIGLHLWQDLQSARDLRTRLWELRVNRPDSTAVTDSVLPAIKILASAQHDFEAIAGIYLGVKQALARAYRSYLEQTHATWDAPSIDIITRISAQKESQIEWAEAYLKQVAPTDSGSTPRPALDQLYPRAHLLSRRSHRPETTHQTFLSPSRILLPPPLRRSETRLPLQGPAPRLRTSTHQR